MLSLGLEAVWDSPWDLQSYQSSAPCQHSRNRDLIQGCGEDYWKPQETNSLTPSKDTGVILGTLEVSM